MTMLVPRATRSRVSILIATVVIVATASSVSAQFRPRIVQETMIGDKFHIEGGADLWFPDRRAPH